MSFGNFFYNKKVLVTGDTGFKGSWLCFWLKQLGAKVYGLALQPNTIPSNFHILQLNKDIEHHTVDIRNFDLVKETVRKIKPEVVFHLAAQALVRLSYKLPLETLETNFLGTAYLLQSICEADYSPKSPCSVVAITSDKCYENRETLHAYCEKDAMGGHDIYSASKGAMELLISSWRKSFFSPSDWLAHGVSLVSVRAGNVMGGGDWAEDRIVVDCVKFIVQNKMIEVRNPQAIRPWQHVLEPLSGYLQLAAEIGISPGKKSELVSAYNFGPDANSERTVEELVESVIRHWGRGSRKHIKEPNAVHEATYLKLSTEKAQRILGWHPTWDFETSVQQTISWYKEAYACDFNSQKMRGLTKAQLEGYTTEATKKGLRWTK